MKGTNNIIIIGTSPSVRHIQHNNIQRFSIYFLQGGYERKRRYTNPKKHAIHHDKCNTHRPKFHRDEKSTRLIRRLESNLTTNMPRQYITPLATTIRNNTPNLRDVRNPSKVMVRRILIRLSPTPLCQGKLLTRRRPPMSILANNRQPSLQNHNRHQVSRTRLDKHARLNRNFRRRQHQKGTPLDNKNDTILGNRNRQALTLPLRNGTNRQINKNKHFQLTITKRGNTTYRRHNNRGRTRHDSGALRHRIPRKLANG